jgi:hypothetical protein
MSERFGSHDCYSATYGVALEQLGHDARVLGGDWGFRYDRDPGHPWPLERLLTTTRPFAEMMRTWYGVETHEREHVSFEAAWDHIRMFSASGQPAIVFVDAFHLPHTGYHQTQHRPHRVLVTECRDDEAHVVDPTLKLAFEGWVEAASMRAAMDSPYLLGLLYSARNVTIDLSQGQPPAVSPADNALRSLRCFGATGTGPLRALAGDMDRDAPVEPDGRLDETRLAEGVMFFGELMSQRLLNGGFLDLAADLTGLEALLESKPRAQRLCDTWDTLRMVFSFVGIKKPHDVLRHLAPRMREVADLEDEFASGIGSALAGAGGAAAVAP